MLDILWCCDPDMGHIWNYIWSKTCHSCVKRKVGTRSELKCFWYTYMTTLRVIRRLLGGGLGRDRLLRRCVEVKCWDYLWILFVEFGCWDSLLSSSVKIINWNQLSRLSAEISCWDYLLRSAVETICWDQLLRLSVEIIAGVHLLRLSIELSSWNDLLR